jgi:hypothetical protein
MRDGVRQSGPDRVGLAAAKRCRRGLYSINRQAELLPAELISQEGFMKIDPKRDKRQGQEGGQPQPKPSTWPGQPGQPGQQWPGKTSQPTPKPSTWPGQPSQPGQSH